MIDYNLQSDIYGGPRPYYSTGGVINPTQQARQQFRLNSGGNRKFGSDPIGRAQRAGTNVPPKAPDGSMRIGGGLGGIQTGSTDAEWSKMFPGTAGRPMMTPGGVSGVGEPPARTMNADGTYSTQPPAPGSFAALPVGGHRDVSTELEPGTRSFASQYGTGSVTFGPTNPQQHYVGDESGDRTAEFNQTVTPEHPGDLYGQAGATAAGTPNPLASTARPQFTVGKTSPVAPVAPAVASAPVNGAQFAPPNRGEGQGYQTRPPALPPIQETQPETYAEGVSRRTGNLVDGAMDTLVHTPANLLNNTLFSAVNGMFGGSGAPMQPARYQQATPSPAIDKTRRQFSPYGTP